MGDLPPDVLVHTVTVQDVTGQGAKGTTYGAPYDVVCFVEAATRRTKTATGATLASSTTVYAQLAGCTAGPGARVTYDGRTALVVQAARHRGGNLDTPDHLELTLE